MYFALVIWLCPFARCCAQFTVWLAVRGDRTPHAGRAAKCPANPDEYYSATNEHIQILGRRVNACKYRTLKFRVHPLKRFIGRTTKGFDFLGYRFKPDHSLGVAAKTTAKMLGRVRRLQEQGADVFELRRYVLHWRRWLHAGLRERVTCWRRFLDLWQAIPNINHRDFPAI